jgi:hypothetical protein
VAVNGNSLRISARRGSAVVETADKTLAVPEGKELDATMAPPPPQASSGTKAASKGKLETAVFVTALAAGVTGLVLGIIAIERPNPVNCVVLSPTGATANVTCP